MGCAVFMSVLVIPVIALFVSLDKLLILFLYAVATLVIVSGGR